MNQKIFFFSLIVSVLLAGFSCAFGKDILGNSRLPCESDPVHTLQDFIDSKTLGSQYVPKDLKFRKISGFYALLEPTEDYIFPKKTFRIAVSGLGCRLACKIKIRPICEVQNDNTVWLVYRGFSDETLSYVDKKNFSKIIRRK